MRFKPYIAGTALAGVAVVALLMMPHRTVRHAAKPRFVFTDKMAYRVQPPLLLTQQKAIKTELTPSGGAVLLMSENSIDHPERMTPNSPPPLVTLQLWDTDTHRLRSVWKNGLFLEAADHGGISVDWLPDTDSAIISLRWTEMTHVDEKGTPHIVPQQRAGALWVNCKTGAVREIPEEEGDSTWISPTKNISLIHSETSHTIRVVHDDGTVGQTIDLPKEYTYASAWWTGDGSQLVVQFNQPVLDAKGVKTGIIPLWAAVDLQAGSLTKLDQKPMQFASAPEPPKSYRGMRIKHTKVRIKEQGTEQTVHPLWLESTTLSAMPRYMLTPDADHGVLAANVSGVLYTSQDRAWFAPLAPVSKAAFLQEMRQYAIKNARQVAISIMMYVQDYDEKFPGAGDDTKNNILPYLKDEDCTDGFSYSFDDKTLASITNPADTEIGSIAGIGGSAIMYADGHVKWRDDPSN